MPTTPAERKALLFLGAVAVLGVGARTVARVRGDVPAVDGMQPQLERQLARAEGQARADRAARAEREARKKLPKASKAGRSRKPARAAGGPEPAPPAAPAVPAIVDVDRADTVALATLPGVGPALARRIAEDRRNRGPFGGMEALDAVPGIGPALLARLAPRVTFSGPRRPMLGKGNPDGAARSTVPATRRRGRGGRQR